MIVCGCGECGSDIVRMRGPKRKMMAIYQTPNPPTAWKQYFLCDKGHWYTIEWESKKAENKLLDWNAVYQAYLNASGSNLYGLGAQPAINGGLSSGSAIALQQQLAAPSPYKYTLSAAAGQVIQTPAGLYTIPQSGIYQISNTSGIDPSQLNYSSGALFGVTTNNDEAQIQEEGERRLSVIERLLEILPKKNK